jgi:hypothetical protein
VNCTYCDSALVYDEMNRLTDESRSPLSLLCAKSPDEHNHLGEVPVARIPVLPQPDELFATAYELLENGKAMVVAGVAQPEPLNAFTWLAEQYINLSTAIRGGK